MTVNEIPVNIRCLEYRQESGDKDCGSCLYARFYFNLDKYELGIISDVGNYAYRWCADDEGFLNLMARIGEDYLLRKLCGEPQAFDYDATKEDLYDTYKDDEEAIEVLDKIFDELYYDEPQTADEFIRRFDDENYSEDNPNEAYFSDTWEFPVLVYTAWQKKIVQVFADYIQPKIKEIIKEERTAE